jgi:phosphate transport system substrate-binding protein
MKLHARTASLAFALALAALAAAPIAFAESITISAPVTISAPSSSITSGAPAVLTAPVPAAPTTPAAPAAPATTLVGSDLLKGACGEVLKKETAAAAPVIALDGSLMGEKFLRDNRAAAALLFIPDKAKVREINSGEWLTVPIAFQTIVVVVNKENKLERLDLDTLASIFGRQQRIETLRSWSTVPGSNLKLPIHPLVTRYELSVATPMFRNRVLQDQSFRTSTSFFTSDAQSLEYLVNTAQSIGILAVPPAGDSVRVVALAAAANSPSAYLPTPENLLNGDYPLAVPLYLVVPKKNLAALRPLLPALFGDTFSAALLKAGFVPVAKNLRKNFQQTLDKNP